MSDINATLAEPIADDGHTTPQADRSMTVILNSSSGVNQTDSIRQQITDALSALQGKVKVITLMPERRLLWYLRAERY
jgi:hypothetical protein